MASGDAIDHHRNTVRYVEAEETIQDSGQFTVAWAADGRRVTVSGLCPACDGRTVTEFPAGVGGTKGSGGVKRRPASLPAVLTLFCECGHVHADRPEGALDKGCGRFWQVSVAADARLPPPAGTP